MKKWLLKVVEGRYRCWEDFHHYGMVSAGHDNPPSAPLKLLSVGDEVYAFIATRGYLGHGIVTQAAVLADRFIVAGNFIAKDGSGTFDRVKLTEILLLRRSDMRNDASDPVLGEWVVGVKWLSTYPKKKAKRFAGMQEPKNTIEEITDAETERFLATTFNT